ncbi:MAG: ATP-binding protein [Alphaproteobacteria bacterium]|nr:ATP-binding protein [Alphaproteobacteria bacterium]
MIKRSQTLTVETKRLLAEGESQTVEFKRNLEAVKVRTLTAIANTPAGGTILVGVDEVDKDGLKVGKVVGCNLGNQPEESLRNKAKEAKPAIDLDISFENTAGEAVIKITIPPSSKRPHSAPSGEYVVRDGIITRGLDPSELLLIFLAQEQSKFLSNFQAATQSLSEQVVALNQEILNTAHAIIDEQTTATEEIIASLLDVQSTVESQPTPNYDNDITFRTLSEVEDRTDENQRLLRHILRLLVSNANGVSGAAAIKVITRNYVFQSLGWGGLLNAGLTKEEFNKTNNVTWDDFLKRSYHHRDFKECFIIDFDEYKQIAESFFPNLAKKKSKRGKPKRLPRSPVSRRKKL